MNMIENTEAASSSIGKSVNELENTTKKYYKYRKYK